ncbi:AAA family ATPase [Sphingomonas koreensis]
MKFRYVELENIFAYDRKVRVDLAGTTREKNVVLIWGRNGMGKTSFLNSLKLLFLGVDYKPVRTIGFPPYALQQRQYVLGDGGRWSGVVNTRARHRAVTAGIPVTASVAAQWEVTDGRIVTATRSWTTTAAGYQEALSVTDGEVRLTGDAAVARLEDFVPREFVGFFFFDGEDIKRLAEMEGIEQSNFDRLLRITFVAELAAEVRRIATERGRSALSEKLREQIRESEDALGRATRLREDAARELEKLSTLLGIDEAELRRMSLRRENLSGGASEAQRTGLEERLQQLRASLSLEESRIIERAPADAPVLANLNLVRAAERHLAERLASPGEGERRLVRRISDSLPAWLEESPVSLDPEDRTRLGDDLSGRINSLAPPAAAVGLFGGLDAIQAQRMYEDLQRWVAAGEDLRSAQLSQLTQVRRHRREIAETEEALITLEVGSQANLEQYRALTQSIERLDGQVKGYHQKIGQQNAKIEEADDLERVHGQRLAELRQQEEAELRTQAEAQFVLRLSAALGDLREGLRSTLRSRLQEALNGRFRLLLKDNDVVERIEIDESYTMTFYNRLGKVGRSSLSSGLKQLAATALLWAMKDTSGVQMPVVIDTPLGRIDRANQNNMLLNYYPELSDQVIVLPTDAEIDQDKFDTLEPRIACQYRIDNPFGDGADIAPGVSLLPSVRHG